MGDTVIEKPTPSVILGGVTSAGSATKSQEAAQKIIDAATTEGVFWGTDVDTAQMAEEIVAMRRTNPDQAFTVEAEIARINPDAGFQSRLYEDIRIISEYAGLANDRLQTLGPDGATPTGAITERAQLSGTVDRLLADATSPIGRNRGGVVGGDLNVTELAYQVEVLAADNPELAQAVRAELTGRLSPADSATFNRIVAGDRGFGEGLGLAFSHPVDTAIGVGQNAANGVIFVGDMAVRGGVAVGGLAADGTALVVEGHAWALERGATVYDNSFGTKVAETVRPAVETLDEVANNQNIFADGAYGIASEPIIPSFECANAAQCVGQDIGTAIDIATGVKGAVTLGVKGVKILRELGEQADEVASSVIGQLDDVVPPVSRQADEVIAPILAREFSVIADNFPAGNQIVLVDGQYWNIPAGKSVADLPLDDLVGDKLQVLTTESAARWNDNPWDMLSTNEVAATLRNSDLIGLATRLMQQAKGRWVERLVKDITVNEISNNPINLTWSGKGLDITDLSTGIKYDIMSGTQHNLRTHALREPNQIFRMLAF